MDLNTLTVPVRYLVAEMREGEWMLGDGWTVDFDTLAEEKETASRWRALPGHNVDRPVGVLAVMVVEVDS